MALLACVVCRLLLANRLRQRLGQGATWPLTQPVRLIDSGARDGVH
jgi:hypothetical protein